MISQPLSQTDTAEVTSSLAAAGPGAIEKSPPERRPTQSRRPRFSRLRQQTIMLKAGTGWNKMKRRRWQTQACLMMQTVPCDQSVWGTRVLQGRSNEIFFFKEQDNLIDNTQRRKGRKP